MASIDIEIDEILWSMSNREKQELADELYDDGFVPKQMGGVHPDDAPTGEFDKELSKLIGNSWRLSKEDEETILRITNKLI